jgi:hypothetical protein
MRSPSVDKRARKNRRSEISKFGPYHCKQYLLFRIALILSLSIKVSIKLLLSSTFVDGSNTSIAFNFKEILVASSIRK